MRTELVTKLLSDNFEQTFLEPVLILLISETVSNDAMTFMFP